MLHRVWMLSWMIEMSEKKTGKIIVAFCVQNKMALKTNVNGSASWSEGPLPSFRPTTLFLGIPVPVQKTVNPTKRDVNFAVLEITKCVFRNKIRMKKDSFWRQKWPWVVWYQSSPQVPSTILDLKSPSFLLKAFLSSSWI